MVKLKSLSLLGMHNVENVLAAFALVEFLKLPRKPVIVAVKSFKGLPHRMETVASSAGVRWVNDSKATNIGAAATALNSLDADLVWIAGGQGKGADFTELRKVVSDRIKLVVLLGEDADQIEHALQDRVEIVRVADMKEAVLIAGQHASEGMVVLLSPACASFDMYQSFAQRGDDFRSLAEAWAEVHGS